MTVQKEYYEKPIIVRHTVGLTNKFGRNPASTPMKMIDGYQISKLIENFGSPLYVVSEATLKRKYKDLKRAFESRYPNVQISYSFKTNYLSGICAVLQNEGAFAEVVSIFEYEIAQRLNFKGDKIIFNGPDKSKSSLELAVANKSVINVDSFEEIYLLEEIAKERNEEIEIGVRLNMELNYPPWSRFGFNYENGQAYEAIKRAELNGLLKVVGLMVHAGTYVDDVQVYQKMALKYVEFYRIIHERLGITLKYLDIGGGFATINTLHQSWLPATQTCPGFDDYAEAICPILLNGITQLGVNPPKLFMEPGRALVDEAMHLITSVISTKRLSTGEKGIVVDAGINLLSSNQWYRYEMQVTQECGTMVENTNVYGNLCMNIDILRNAVPLPSLRRGDSIIIKNVGAYNFSQSLQFIQFRPAIVMIRFDGKVELIRKREDTNYLLQLESVPQDLKK
ncbi:alanine racemase [bacterium]|nr:alanine racemase [bacterium]